VVPALHRSAHASLTRPLKTGSPPPVIPSRHLVYYTRHAGWSKLFWTGPGLTGNDAQMPDPS
jgi:hypothetical protein